MGMKRTLLLFLAVFSGTTSFAQWTEEGFRAPAQAYKPLTWYHWQNGNIGKDAVREDLASMHEVGLGGFYLFNSAEGAPAGADTYFSDAWWADYRFLQEEAAEYGLEMGVMNGAGWSVSGGPWVAPEDAMQEVVWTETRVDGPSRFDGILSQPVPCVGFERDMQRDPVKNRRYYVSREELAGYYHDIVVLAFPTPAGDLAGHPYHIEGWWAKAGYSKMNTWEKDGKTAPENDVIRFDDMVNLTDSVGADGHLSWDVPVGSWTILRIGYQPTGRKNHPAAEGGSGLEVDKLSTAALDRYWEASTARLLEGSDIVSKVLIDSYEAGHQNWTAGFEQAFIERMGYDPRPYLPAVTGKVVGGTGLTERFLWDYRKVISDLLNERFYDRFAQLAHRHGVQLAIEPYGQFGNTDEYSTGATADILAGEFWAGENAGSTNRTTMKLAASLSHLYGKEIVGAEAFTSSGRMFEVYPGMLKTQGDYYFCQGMNQVWLHSFVHDPYDAVPGMTLGSYGTHFNRRNTWWKHAGPWFTYLARCQYMLRQGVSSHEILYYMGEDASSRPPRSEDLHPSVPEGYDYDFCGGSRILSLLKARKGILTAPGGTEYRLLVVRPRKCMRPGVLEQLLTLVRDGAVVCMDLPEETPGLGEGETSLNEHIACLPPEKDGCIRYGKGRIYPIGDLKAILQENGVNPALEVSFPEGFTPEETQYPGGPVLFAHRKSRHADIYFLSNQQPHTAVAPTLVFNVKRMLPEIWNPKEGSIRPVEEFETMADGRIRLRLPLEESGSVFVVFRYPARKASESLSAPVPEWNRTTLSGPWEVSLLPGLSGAGKSFTVNTLSDLSGHEDPAVKYFSGEILYKTRFQAERTENGRFLLDLGRVGVLAEVRVNGQPAGTCWCEPYRIDIGDWVNNGENELEIKVVNLLINRVAGDLLLPEDREWTTETGSTAPGYSLARFPQWLQDGKESPTGRRTFTTWYWPYMKGKPLPLSGLAGPVFLLSN